MVWLCTVAPLWQTKARRRKSISTLSLLSQLTHPFISVTTSSTQRWELIPAYCVCTSFFFFLHYFPYLNYFSVTFSSIFSQTFPKQALTALLSDDSKFGFIVIDGSGALFGTLQGNTREVMHKFTVDLPKKHGTDLQYSKNTNIFIFLTTQQGSIYTILHIIL